MAAKDCKPLPELSESDIDRFWTFIDTAPGHGPKGTCWIWKGGKCGGDRGYGLFTIKGRTVRASRVAWSLASGADPFPLLIMHRCDYPPCVRVDHLRTGTTGDNTIDARNKGRIRNGSDHAIRPPAKPHNNGYVHHDNRRFTFTPIPAFTEQQSECFWTLVDKRGKNECWPFIGPRDRDGYGHIFGFVAARVAYRIQTGEDPGYFYVCHSCDSPPCVNARHLVRGTQKDNMRDASRKGRLHLNNPHPSQQGVNNHRAVLTVEQVIAIRTLHREHPEIPQRQIAKTYEIHPTHVGDILTYRIWKHLP